MKRPNTFASKRNCWTAAALVLALLFAQFTGLQHRIEHAGWQADSQFGQPLSGSDQGKPDGTHSCAVFDAATMADAVNAAPCMAPLAGGAYALARHPLPASWTAPVFHHFSSRAPPPVVS